ncbi:MAG: glycosyltransferase, partial [Planctomycetes bacterium]|nr:glycosyltransferase [Planctomycetota bacterium]
MRVLDLNTLYIDGGEGGVNTYLREKARCLDGAVCPSTGARVHHTIVVPGARDSRTTFGGSTLYTLRSPRLPGNRQHRLLVDFPRVARLLRDERPDLIEVDCSYILGHVAARAVRPRRVPIVGFYHVHLPLLYTRAGLGWVRRRLSSRTEPLAWGYVRLCARPCSRVIVTTRDMRARLEGRRLPRL